MIDPHGIPVQPVPDTDQVTVPLLTLVTTGVNCWVPPASRAADGGNTDAVAPLARPEPLRATDCVAPDTPPELSVRVKVAAYDAAAAGEKLTLITHVPFGAIDRLAVHVVPEAIAKSVLPLPLSDNAGELNNKFAVPVFVTVTLKAALVVPTV